MRFSSASKGNYFFLLFVTAVGSLVTATWQLVAGGHLIENAAVPLPATRGPSPPGISTQGCKAVPAPQVERFCAGALSDQALERAAELSRRPWALGTVGAMITQLRSLWFRSCYLKQQREWPQVPAALSISFWAQLYSHGVTWGMPQPAETQFPHLPREGV